MEFKSLVKLYFIRGLSMVFALVFLIGGPASCAGLMDNRSKPLHIVGLLLGILGLVGGIALIAVAVAAKHFLFKDAYNDRTYIKKDSDVNITYRKRNWW